MPDLNQEQIGILRHTAERASIRGVFCGDSPEMQELVRLGMMRSLGRVSWVPDEYFGITDAGRAAVREYTGREVR